MTHNVTSPPSIDALQNVHSITSSAIESTAGGTSMPSARAACRLRTNSNLAQSEHRAGSKVTTYPNRLRFMSRAWAA